MILLIIIFVIISLYDYIVTNYIVTNTEHSFLSVTTQNCPALCNVHVLNFNRIYYVYYYILVSLALIRRDGPTN